MKSFATLLLISVFATVLPAKDTEPAAAKAKEATQAAKTKQRIEEVFENNRKLIRFHDKDGKKIKEIDLEQKETKIRINQNKPFNPSNFKLKISSQIAETIEEIRKSSGRDVELYRSEYKEVSFSGNKQFVVVEDGYLDFVDFADASDGERAEEATESVRVTTIYGQEGNKIIELSKADGWQPIVSNTGEFFIVTIGEYEKHRIINREKETLAEVSYHRGNKFFSTHDRYILLENEPEGSEHCEWTIYDTKERKLELGKVLLKECSGDVNKIEILEDKREIVMRHEWDMKTNRWLVPPIIERIKF